MLYINRENYRQILDIGNGTKDDPFLIEEIEDPNMSLIIRDLQFFIIVKNCEFYNIGIAYSDNITVVESKFKHITISRRSSHITIKNCDISNYINLERRSNNIKIENCKTHRISLSLSHLNMIKKNQIDNISLYKSRGNTIEENTMLRSQLERLKKKVNGDNRALIYIAFFTILATLIVMIFDLIFRTFNFQSLAVYILLLSFCGIMGVYEELQTKNTKLISPNEIKDNKVIDDINNPYLRWKRQIDT